MPTELEELLEFLHHGNSQIRAAAAEHLVGYSTTQPAIFKTPQLVPLKDLKLLVKDYSPIAKHALTILINISDDPEVLQNMATDDAFLESLFQRITGAKEPNADEMTMLLANLAKHDSIRRVVTNTRAIPKGLSTSKLTMVQLMDCFVKGAEGKYNSHANYDYLSYFFADMAKYEEIRKYFVSPQASDDDIIPLTKLIVFTEHKSSIRRRGVASTIKNAAFDVPSHPLLMSADHVNLLPYILLPIMGSEEYSDEDTEGMLDDLQLLPPDKEREKDLDILKTHLDTLLLLTTTKDGREVLRRIKVYPIVRETHLHVDDEEVREACDRIVQVLMRDEGPDEADGQVQEVDEDEQLIDIL